MRADGQGRRREGGFAGGVEGDVGASVVAPSVNVDGPAGALPVFGPVVIVTVAVNVTAWPNTDGLAEERQHRFGRGVVDRLDDRVGRWWRIRPGRRSWR